MAILPARAKIIEVGCRDGFQNEKKFIETEDKIRIVNSLSRLGFKKLEMTSFVSPKAIPQMRDASEVVRGADRVEGVAFTALVPNLKGAERAIEAGIDELNVVISVSESHNLANIRMTPKQSLERLKDIVDLAGKHKKPVTVGLATVFGCPFEGSVPVEKVLAMAEEALEIGATYVSLADTTGMANPAQVLRLVECISSRLPSVPSSLHFHNTRGMGMANVLAGLEAGVTTYDAALAGLGGCPFAPGATGNVATEDVVHMLEEMGIKTGIDLDGLINLSRELEKIIGRTLPGQIIKAGKAYDLHPMPCDLQQG